MHRREFLKILGVTSIAVALPTGLNYLLEHVTKNNYKPDLLYELFGDLINKLTPEELKYLDSLNWNYTVYRLNNKGVYRVTNDLQRRLDYKGFGKGKEVNVVFSSNNIFEATLKQYLYNKELGLRTANNFDSPYFWNVIRSYRAKSDRSKSKLSKALTGRKINPETTAKIHATRKLRGNTGGGENQKIAVREHQLQRTKEERQKAWLKVDAKARYDNYKDKESHRQKAIENMKHKMTKIETYKDGKLVGSYKSIMEASRQLDVNCGSISLVLNPKYPKSKSAGGYTFKKV